MKLSHKIVMVSAAALMAVSPVVAGQSNFAQAATSKTTKKSTTNTKTTTKTTNANSAANIVTTAKTRVYDENGKLAKTYMGSKKWTTIAKGVKLISKGTKTIDGEKYYSLGNSSYIKASDATSLSTKKKSTTSTKDTKSTEAKSSTASSSKSTKASTSTSKTTATKTTTKKTTAKKTTKKVTPKLAKVTKNSYVYDKNGKRIKSAGTLKKNAEITYVGTMSLGDDAYYNLGSGRYVKANNVETADTVKVVKNAFAYDKNGKRNKAAGVVKKNAKIETLGTKKIKGKEYYYIGAGRYIKSGNIEKKTEDSEKEITYIKLVKNSIVYDENGDAYSPEILFSKGAEYQAYSAKKIDGKWYYQVGNDSENSQWIKAVNAYVESGPKLIDDSSYVEPSPSTTNASTDTVVTLRNNASTYNNKGQVVSNQTFAEGYRLRVSERTWIWIASENKAEEFYKIVSKDNSYIKVSDVSTLSGTSLVANNTPEQARQAATVATATDKANLNALVNTATTVRNSVKYTGSSSELKTAYDNAISKAQSIISSTTASVLDVNNAVDAVKKAEAALNGQAQPTQPATSTTTTDTNNNVVNNSTETTTQSTTNN